MDGRTVQKFELIKKDTGERYTMRIRDDTDSESPREWDHPGTMACWHGRYNLGDNNPYQNSDDFLIGLIEEYGSAGKYDLNGLPDSQLWQAVRELDGIVILPVYLLDHSGLSVSTDSFNDYWDSGQIGWIYVDKKSALENYDIGSQDWRAVAEQHLKGEVAEYDTWLRGEIYGFTIERETECPACRHIEKETVDSCRGFYGTDWQDNGLYDQAGIGGQYIVLPSREERAI